MLEVLLEDPGSAPAVEEGGSAGWVVLVVILVLLAVAGAVLLGTRKVCASAGAAHAPVTTSELLWELEQKRWALAEKVLDAKARINWAKVRRRRCKEWMGWGKDGG